MTTAFEKRSAEFWSKVDRSDFFGCWLWRGTIDPGNGYGRLKVNKRPVYAHRFAYEITAGPIEPQKSLLHDCATKICVNPTHTYPGDQKQNAADAKRDGALTGRKLNEKKAREIVQLHRDEKLNYLILAEKFGVSPQAIANVCRGRTWSKATGIECAPHQIRSG